MIDLHIDTVKALFPEVEGLPIKEGWHLFIPKNVRNWIVPFTFILIAYHKGEMRVVEDGDYIPFQNWCKGEWFGPISNKIAKVLKQ